MAPSRLPLPRIRKRRDRHEFALIEPGKRGGRPSIRGMRIAVADVLGWLAAGMTHEEIISDYPELTEEQINEVVAEIVKALG